MNLAIKTFGCKVNQLASEQAAFFFSQHGHTIVDQEQAELLIVNSCTVTEHTDRKIRSFIQHWQKNHPQQPVYVTGCGSRTSQAFYEDLTNVKLYPDWAQIKKIVGSAPTPRPLSYPPPRTRAFVQIQDGCDNFCSYCLTINARGRSRSRPPEDIITEINELSAAGCPEVVLTGINIGAYGTTASTRPEESKLATLIDQILTNTSIPHLRLSSLGPQYLSPALIALFANSRLRDYLHLSLQSGCDHILHAMNRPYLTAEIIPKVTALRALRPNLGLAADVIVGFPGETDQDFQTTVDFCTQLNFAKLHIFPFSSRPGTAAAQLTPPPTAVRQQRATFLRQIGHQLRRHFKQKFIGQTLSVLIEKKTGEFYTGWSSNYLEVAIASSQNLRHQEINVRITDLRDETLLGQFTTDI